MTFFFLLWVDVDYYLDLIEVVLRHTYFTQRGVILIAYIIDKALELAARSRDSNGQWVNAVG